jgi:NAD-dependent dihydropyrimidine dehydrogenase PreA subunit
MMEEKFSKKIVIHYTSDNVDQPIIYELVKRHDLVFNILKARIYPRREGVIVLELIGSKDNFDQGIHYLKEKGLKVEPLSKNVIQNTDKCVYCGACTAFCPTTALSFNKETMKVVFNVEKCNGCELCVTACPVRAMEVNLL